MKLAAIIRRLSALLPILMSLSAFSVVLVFAAIHGIAPQQDEGAAARIWQSLMGCQLPIIVFFAIEWLPQAPKHALQVLGLQLVAAVAAVAPVFLLHW